jgi:hypothetical protein
MQKCGMSRSAGEAMHINRIEQGQRPMKEAEEGRRPAADDGAMRGEFASGTGWYDAAAPVEGSTGPETYDDRRRPGGMSGPTQISRRTAGLARNSSE